MAIKSITNKRVVLKKEKLCGRVMKSNQYLVTVLFDNGIQKIYTRDEFFRVCELETTKIAKKQEDKSISIKDLNFKERMTLKIEDYLDRHFKKDVIVFCKYDANYLSSVRFNGYYCGYMAVSDTAVIIKFKAYIPPPAISKYLVRTKDYCHTYKFKDLSRATIDDMYIAINWLLLVGKKKQDEDRAE